MLIACTRGYAQWTDIGPGGNALSGVSFRTAADGWVCGANGTLLRTADGGATWATEPEFHGPGSGAHTRLLAVTTPGRYDVAVLGQQPSATRPTTVYHSGYSGHGFTDAFSDYGDYTFLSSRTDRLSLLVGYGGALAESVALGDAWQVLTSGTQNDLFGADSPDGDVYYVVGAKGTLRKGSGPRYNNSRALNSTTFARLTAVWFVDLQQGYIVGDGGTALRTADGGTTWAPMPVGNTVNLNAVRFLNATTGFIVGDLGTLLLTTDGGQSWHPEPSNTFESLNGIFATPDGLHTWVVGGSGIVLKRGAVSGPLAGRPAATAPAWHAYPNPFTTALTLALPARGPAGPDVRLVDPLGRVVLHQAAGPAAAGPAGYPLAVPAGLAPGVYTLQVTAAGQAPEVQRLVRLP